MAQTDGFLIALEGIDGSGTTTQAVRLAHHLETCGETRRQVLRTAEPSTGPIGRLIREALRDTKIVGDEALALLFAADRIDHIETEIGPAITRGAVVITDRYLLSSLAYQSSYLPTDWVLSINARARRPDASILLRVSAETAEQRRQHRGGETERFDAIERQRRIASAYEQALTLPNVGPTYVLDAEADIDVVTDALTRLVDRLLSAFTAQNYR